MITTTLAPPSLAAVLPPQAASELIDAVGLPVGRWDAQHRLVACNQPYVAWAGQPREALLGRTLAQLYGENAWAAASNAFAAALAGRASVYERRLTHQQGRWARIQVFPQRDERGGVCAVCTIAHDIHDDVVQREAYELARKRMLHFTDNIPYPLTYVDSAFVLRFVNKAYMAATGQSAAQLLGRHIGEVRGAKRWAEHRAYFERALEGEAMQYTRLTDRADLGPRWMRTSYVPDFDDERRVVGLYTVTIDVHELTVAQQQLKRHAEHDALTDAFSRRTMMERIEAAVNAAGGPTVGLFFVDLDDFKKVNDLHGHAAGDRLLVAVTQALQHAVRADDAVGRFGGDEFLVLASVRDAAGGHVLGQHLLQAVRDCGGLPGAGAAVSASIGYALAPLDARQPMRLLQRADEAMYMAKRSGKNRVVHGGRAAPM